MKKRVILHLMNGFKDASIGRIVIRLVSALGNDGYQWHIGGLSEVGEMRPEFEQIGARTVVFDQRDHILEQIRHYLVENQVEIIHTHTMRTLLPAWLATCQVGRQRHLPVFHVATKHIFTSPGDRRWGLLYAAVDCFSLLLPDVLVPVSHTMGEKMQKIPAIHPRSVVVIPNAIPGTDWYQPESRQEFRRRFQIEDDVFVLGFGGRFEPIKRLDILLTAFSRLRAVCPNVHLLMAGEGSLRPSLEYQANRLQISPAVTWVGFCREMPAFLSALDVYVQTSVNEGLPLSVLEAMAAGKVVIATPVGGVPEVITDDQNGILIPPQSVDGLVAALFDLLEHPNKMASLAGQARQTIQERFGLEGMSKGYQNLYESLTS